MNPTLLRCALALLLAGSLSTPALSARAQAMSDDAQTFAAATEAYGNSHWALIYALLAPLPDRGHAGASRVVLQMHRWGPRLYGQRFPADAERSARWQRDAPCGTVASAPATCAHTTRAQ